MICIKETSNLSSQTYQDALTIRKEVFVDEQQVPLSIEIDQEDVCIHFVLYDNEVPQATVRIQEKDNLVYKIQRMAVLKSARKKGYGRQLMTYVEEFAKHNHMNELMLGAQDHAIPFYEALGYQVFGEEYLDAGIKHFDMKKEL